MRIGINIQLPVSGIPGKRPSDYQLYGDDGTLLGGFAGKNPDSVGVTATNGPGATFGDQGSVVWTVNGVDYTMNTVVFNTTN